MNTGLFTAMLLTGFALSVGTAFAGGGGEGAGGGSDYRAPGFVTVVPGVANTGRVANSPFVIGMTRQTPEFGRVTQGDAHQADRAAPPQPAR